METAIQRWKALFYCGRCDGVFVPGNDSFAPMDKLRSYLNDGDERFAIDMEGPEYPDYLG
jgi:hypothetical protein